MGTGIAPSFANKHMSKFEDEHVYTYHLQPFIYARYLDDILIVWQHGLYALNKFEDHLKSRTECSREMVSFLDTKVKLRNGNLIQICIANPLTPTVIYCTVQPIHTTVGKAFPTASSYGSNVSVATSLILTNTLWNLHLTSMSRVIPASWCERTPYKSKNNEQEHSS